MSTDTARAPLDYAPSEIAAELRATLGTFLARHHDPVEVRAQTLGDEPFDPGLWRRLATELGVAGAVVDEEYGGAGLGADSLAAVAGELGRVLYAGPWLATHALAVPVLSSLARAGSEPAGELLRRVVDEGLALTLATDPALAAQSSPDGWAVTGRCDTVLLPHRTELLLVVAASPDGAALLAVRREDVVVTEVPSIDPSRALADVALDAAPAQLLGTGDDVDRALRDGDLAASFALAAESVGAARACLALTVGFVKVRHQFGRPVGSFQAVQHGCARDLIAIERADCLVRYAAAGLDAGAEDLADAVAAAHVSAVEAFLRTAENGIQYHGTIGYTREALPQSFFRRARWNSLFRTPASQARTALGARVLRRDPATLARTLVPAEDAPVRTEVREWLAATPAPTGRQLLEAGYMLPRWPAPWGRDLDGAAAFQVDEELARAGVARPGKPASREFVGPLLQEFGTPGQRERFLGPMLAAEEIWCELFSEPEAGSDLAALRTSAVRVDGGYVVNGTKIWTSHAHESQFGILLARTDPDVAKHHGISCFIVPMDAPGITCEPILTMDGFHYWDLVTFSDCVLSPELLVGGEGDGWGLAMRVLANERLMMSNSEGLVWGEGPSFRELLGTLDPERATARADDVAAAYADMVALHVMRAGALVGDRSLSATVPEIRRYVADLHGQAVLELWKELQGAHGVRSAPDPDAPADEAWARHYFDARSLTLGGGTTEIQLTIIAERTLGLPRV